MSRLYLIALFIIVCAGIFLRMYPMQIPLSHDEWYTFDVINRDLTGMNIQMFDDVHVPLYFYIAKISTIFFGMSEMSLRILSLIFGIIGILVFAYATRQFLGERISILAAGFLSLSVFHVSYSQIARMYSLLFLLATLVLLFLFQIMFRQRKWTILGYVLTNLALLYTHVFGYFLFLFELVSLWKFRNKINNFGKVLKANIIVFVFSIPVHVFVVIQIWRKIIGTSYANWMPKTELIDIYHAFAAISSNDLLIWPIVILFVYFVYNHYRNGKKESDTYVIEELILLGLAVCFVLPVVITFITPVFAWRYFFIAYPFFILFICISLSDIYSNSRSAYYIMIIAFFLLLGFSDVVDMNKKIDNKRDEVLCAGTVNSTIEKYKKLNSVFISTRWLNEWVVNHKPIVGAHERLQDMFGIKTILINDFDTDIGYLFDKYDYVVNISPSGWSNNFLDKSKLSLVENESCYGYSYEVYSK